MPCTLFAQSEDLFFSDLINLYFIEVTLNKLTSKNSRVIVRQSVEAFFRETVFLVSKMDGIGFCERYGKSSKGKTCVKIPRESDTEIFFERQKPHSNLIHGRPKTLIFFVK